MLNSTQIEKCFAFLTEQNLPKQIQPEYKYIHEILKVIIVIGMLR